MNSHKRLSALVLLSGGLDSSANLALAAADGWRLECLNVNYGQMAADREVQASEALCAHYSVPLHRIDLSWLGDLGGSALTDASRDLPTPGKDQLDDLAVVEGTAKAVWVPNRNGVLLNVAAAFAEARGLDHVLVGFNREEAVTFPDNSSEYLQALNQSFRFSTREASVSARSFTDRLDKKEIVASLRALKDPAFPFDALWSCYRSAEKPCGECESCRRLARALEG
jgi:7-cyano-7-deazaguanine synthase